MMETKQVKEARAYIEDQCKIFGDIDDIAWKFLLGNSILEQLQKIGFDINDVKFDIKDIKFNPSLTDADIYLNISKETPKSNGGNETPINQPNSSEDLGH